MSAEEEIREAVDEVKAPGTFNIVEVLQGRGYPETSVDIYLNEAAIYRLSIARENLEELDKSLVKGKETEADKKRREEIESEIEEAQSEIVASHYTVHLRGVSEGRREELYKQCVKKYPIEYETTNGMSTLLGGKAEKIEKDSPQRDQLFTDFLWQEHLVKIVDPQGNEQTDFAYSTVRTMRETLPLNAMVKVNEAIEKLRGATALFDVETGEDFLARP